MLSHRNATLLYQTYRELVTFEAAEEYWNIIPESVIQEKEAVKQAEWARRDEEEKEWAEMESNCCLAMRNEHGRWVPVQDENRFGEPYKVEV